MPDDLDSFFKKKGQKKKKPIVQVEKLGKKLEKTAKKQEEIDREDEERNQREKDSEEFIQKKMSEDTEWIEFHDEKEVNIEELGIKEMDIIDEEQNDENEAQEQVPINVKTWKTKEQTESEQSKAAAALAEQQQQQSVVTPAPRAVYRPPHVTLSQGGSQQKNKPVNVEDVHAFPSLSDAGNIEMKKKEHEKRIEQTKLNEVKRQVAEQKEAEPAVELNKNPNAYVPPSRRAGAPAPVPSQQQQSSVYQPPRGPTTDYEGYQQQSAPRRAPNAWGPAAPQAHNTPNVANNRFDALKD